MRRPQEVAKFQEGVAEAVSVGNKGTEMAGNEASTRQQALLGAVAVGDKFTHFRCPRVKTAEPTERSGAYCVRMDTGGRKKVGELGTAFAQSTYLCTVVDMASPTEGTEHQNAKDLNEGKLATPPCPAR